MRAQLVHVQPHRKAETDTGVSLGFALLAYMLGVTLIITLLPFRFQWPDGVHVQLRGEWIDVVANVLLFVPLGFLYCLTVPRERGGGLASALFVGAVLSSAIETVQLFEPSRNTAVSDLLANTCGMGLGALGFARIARVPRVEGRLIAWLALELPLMTLTYLLVPLLWVNTLAAGTEGLRTAATLLIGAFGATIVGGVQRNYLGPAGAARPHHTAVFTALWFAAGAFAMLRVQPVALAAGVVALGALCWWLGARPSPADPNRRFEVPLLRSAALYYVAYLALIVAAPLLQEASAWHFQWGFPRNASDQLEILRLLELGAAFTLVGYMAAEIRGRTAARYGDSLRRLIAWGGGLALAVEAVRGFDPGSGASLARGALLAAAPVYGGWLYYLQRAHVVQHLTRPASMR